MKTNDYGVLLQKLRSNEAMTVEEVAAEIGLTRQQYYDLEAGHDLDQVISLKEFYGLCELFKISPYDLFPSSSNPEDRPINFTQLKDEIEKFLIFRQLSVEEFEQEIGWTLPGYFQDPKKALLWNIDCLRDVCNKLDLEWRDVRPTSQSR